MLKVIAASGGSRYGLGIKADLEEYYDEEVNHGRLYPNLDALVDAGLLEKSQLDRRTNEYALTADAKRVLVNEHARDAEKLNELEDLDA
ncbi:PadR family transcriptional regulator (plasmid) [Halorussus vallis]|nr:helix-turn-helix transcriptional regulator [Halorussus vallis]USZ78744.1 PadR family transcriptional regulator [Halorussus vallis]